MLQAPVTPRPGDLGAVADLDAKPTATGQPNMV
jgi:hypothetical protein